MYLERGDIAPKRQEHDTIFLKKEREKERILRKQKKRS